MRPTIDQFDYTFRAHGCRNDSVTHFVLQDETVMEASDGTTVRVVRTLEIDVTTPAGR